MLDTCARESQDPMQYRIISQSQDTLPLLLLSLFGANLYEAATEHSGMSEENLSLVDLYIIL